MSENYVVGAHPSEVMEAAIFAESLQCRAEQNNKIYKIDSGEFGG